MEDVLQTAFQRLHDMEREMVELTERMAGDSDPALLRRYDALTAAYEAGGGYDTTTPLNKVCNGLEISQDMRSQLFSSLSGGEKTRVNLARLILEDTDILLLDEPTNHLDLRATEWLEDLSLIHIFWRGPTSAPSWTPGGSRSTTPCSRCGAARCCAGAPTGP